MTIAANVVPKRVVDATCEMAREILIADRTASPLGEGLTSTRLADSEVVFDKADRRPVLTMLVQAMLAKFGMPLTGGSGVARLVRV
jgi:hypothetical protein